MSGELDQREEGLKLKDADGAADEAADEAEGEALATGAFVEVYSTDNELVARMVMDELLRPQGLVPALHDRRSHSVPAPAAMAGTLGVAVRDSEAARARELLREAQNDKILYSDGEDGHIVGETVR